MSKIAWLHFDYITKGETENLAQITAGIHLAAENGAAYILTPELAVQGYHFTQQGKPYVIHTDLCALLQPVLHRKVVTVHHVQAKANVAVTTVAHAATKLLAIPAQRPQVARLDGVFIRINSGHSFAFVRSAKSMSVSPSCR